MALTKITTVARRASLEGRALRAFIRTGWSPFGAPSKAAAIGKAMRTYGSFGAATKLAALQHGDTIMITDDRGDISYPDVEEAVCRLTNAFLDLGLQAGDGVGVLCRNHRAPLIVSFAAARAGCKSIWLNSGFSAQQAEEVSTREGIKLLVHDEEFADIVKGLDLPYGRYTWAPEDTAPEDRRLDTLIASGSPEDPPGPSAPGKIILLTSGTTGTPKGAPRNDPKGLAVPGALLERMPLKTGEVTVIAPPIFHGTGLLYTMLSIAIGNRIILRSRFDAAQTVKDISDYGATSMCVVPIMLARMLREKDALEAGDFSKLRAIFVAGSQLPADTVKATQDTFGDVIYNLYASTEVSLATMATPEDLRVNPVTVGKPMLGITVKLYDEHGRPTPQGQTGRIFVGGTMQFEGYTGGGTKDVIDGLMSTGDVGHFDTEGRLYIDGRDDDMIISGGENVFPVEVEETLLLHDAVADVSVIGVDDAEWGQRLRAFVVAESAVDAGDELEATLIKHVKETLARYKAPREVVFLDQIPRNPTGKVLKRELRQL